MNLRASFAKSVAATAVLVFGAAPFLHAGEPSPIRPAAIMTAVVTPLPATQPAPEGFEAEMAEMRAMSLRARAAAAEATAQLRRQAQHTPF